jgi:hypothetical protein
MTLRGCVRTIFSVKGGEAYSFRTRNETVPERLIGIHVLTSDHPWTWKGEDGPWKDKRKTSDRICPTVKKNKSSQKPIPISWLMEIGPHFCTRNRLRDNCSQPEKEGKESDEQKYPPDEHSAAAGTQPWALRSAACPCPNHGSNNEGDQSQDHRNERPVQHEERSIQP